MMVTVALTVLLLIVLTLACYVTTKLYLLPSHTPIVGAPEDQPRRQ